MPRKRIAGFKTEQEANAMYNDLMEETILINNAIITRAPNKIDIHLEYKHDIYSHIVLGLWRRVKNHPIKETYCE